MKIETKILKLIEISLTESENKFFIDYDAVDKKIEEFINKSINLKIKDFVHSVDLSGIKHALKHKNIKASDILLLPLIVSDYDLIGFGKKENTIVYKKQIGDYYFVVEEIRKGRKKLTMKTLYKYKKRTKK
jgi:hypothetical protein